MDVNASKLQSSRDFLSDLRIVASFQVELERVFVISSCTAVLIRQNLDGCYWLAGATGEVVLNTSQESVDMVRWK